MDKFEFEPIGVIRTCFLEKFSEEKDRESNDTRPIPFYRGDHELA
jgi:hypothetical protein